MELLLAVAEFWEKPWLQASAELSAEASLPASVEFSGMELLLAAAESSGKASRPALHAPRLETAPAPVNATVRCQCESMQYRK